MLTDIICRNAQSTGKIYRLHDAAGLYLEVSVAGGKAWRFKYVKDKKEKRLSLGHYPNVSLKEARLARDKAKILLSEGGDPVIAKKLQRPVSNHHFEVVAREWFARNKDRWADNTAEMIITRLESHIFPVLGNIPITQITTPFFFEHIKNLEKTGKHEVVKRVLRYCSRVFQYANIIGVMEHNPAINIRGALQFVPHGHYATITSDELPEFIRVLDSNSARLYQPTIYGLKLLMHTFVRTSELIKATWDEFDLENATWNIPAHRMKMRLAHVVPLSRQVLRILEELKKYDKGHGWILPSYVRGKNHISDNTLLFGIRRMGYGGRMTGHGFRALAMTTLKEKIGYRHEVIDRQLAHKEPNSVIRAYDRAQFIDERRVMMQAWSDYLDAAVLKA
jgi:integrase